MNSIKVRIIKITKISVFAGFSKTLKGTVRAIDHFLTIFFLFQILKVEVYTSYLDMVTYVNSLYILGK